MRFLNASTFTSIGVLKMDYSIEDDVLEKLEWDTANPENQEKQKATVYYFMLTTCAHCKRGKKWYDEHGVTYNWLYLDKIPLDQKKAVKKWLKAKYKLNVGFPYSVFRINGTDFPSMGFDKSYWETKV